MADERMFTVILAPESGVSRDEVQNSFVVDFPGPPSGADIDAVAEAIGEFYTSTHPLSGVPLDSFIGSSVSRAANAHRILEYNISGHLDGSPHGSAVSTHTFTLGDPDSAVDLPRECSAVLTLQADDYLDVNEEGAVDPAIPTPASAIRLGAPATHSGTTRPRARRRGRIYLGPLTAGCLASASGGPYFNASFLNTVAASLSFLVADLDTIGVSTHPNLAVWSRREAAVHALSSVPGDRIGWIDDAPDTTRRRGQAASGRQFITA